MKCCTDQEVLALLGAPVHRSTNMDTYLSCILPRERTYSLDWSSAEEPELLRPLAVGSQLQNIVQLLGLYNERLNAVEIS